MELILSSSPSTPITLGHDAEMNTSALIDVCQEMRQGAICSINNFHIDEMSIANMLAYLKQEQIEFNLNEVFDSQEEFWTELLRRETQRVETLFPKK